MEGGRVMFHVSVSVTDSAAERLGELGRGLGSGCMRAEEGCVDVSQ